MIVRPADTVEAVAHRSERAHDVMKSLGLDQCCGAGLTLVEAAAAAGVPLDTLLARLEEALAAGASS
jgi:iron-sulfur cluster repair protein YtfE (RIC family)